MCRWKKLRAILIIAVCVIGFSLISSSESARAAEAQTHEHQNISIKVAGGETSNGSVWDSILNGGNTITITEKVVGAHQKVSNHYNPQNLEEASRVYHLST